MKTNWNVEEHKTYIGQMMSDLRGDWAYNYSNRIEECINSLEALIEMPTISPKAKKSFQADLETCYDEMEADSQDGRIFRDCGDLYCYSTPEGLSKRVTTELTQKSNNWSNDV